MTIFPLCHMHTHAYNCILLKNVKVLLYSRRYKIELIFFPLLLPHGGTLKKQVAEFQLDFRMNVVSQLVTSSLKWPQQSLNHLFFQDYAFSGFVSSFFLRNNLCVCRPLNTKTQALHGYRGANNPQASGLSL